MEIITLEGFIEFMNLNNVLTVTLSQLPEFLKGEDGNLHESLVGRVVSLDEE